MSDERELPYKMDSPHKITLYKNGKNPYFYYYFTWKKKSYRGSTGKKDLETSKQEVFDIFYEVKTGKRKNEKRVSSKFDIVRKEFLKQKKHTLSEKTYKLYKSEIDILKKRFDGYKIEDISQKVFDDYVSLRKQFFNDYKRNLRQRYIVLGKKIDEEKMRFVGSVPLNREMTLLQNIMRYFKKKHDLNDIRIPHYKMSEEKEGRETLNDEEYERLRDYMSKNRPYRWKIIEFVNSCGVRYPSEVLSIKRKDVDFSVPCVWIRNRKHPNKKEHIINTPYPLVGKSFEIVKELYDRENELVGKEPEDRLFVNDKGKIIKDIRKCFKESLKKCNIERDVCLYSFRTRYTTRHIRQNTISPVVLGKLLGHSGLKRIMKNYTMLQPSDYVEIMKESREVYYQKKELKKQKQKSISKIQHTKSPSLSNEPPSYLDLYSQSDT